MTFQYAAAHHQHELEDEAERERIARLARASAHRSSAVARAREALGSGIVELGLALGGDGIRRRTEDRPGPHSIAV
jgi:hypothetical protein